MSDSESKNNAKDPDRPRSNPARLASRKYRDFGALTHGELVSRAAGGFKGTLTAACILVFAATLTLILRQPDYALAFFGISIAAAIPVACWYNHSHKGLPVLPAFALQQAIIHLVPLYVENKGLEEFTQGVMGKSALSIMLFLILLMVGWYFGRQALQARPSNWNIRLTGCGSSQGRAMSIALSLLALAFIFEMLSFSDTIHALLPGQLSGAIPPLRAFAAAAAAIGALLGGYSVSTNKGTSHSIYYWALLAGIAALSISGVLLSTVIGLVAAATVGQALGARRVPWAFLTITTLILGFLNLGKFTMRERYWESMGGTNIEKVVGESTSRISIYDLPKFYGEWAAASMEKISNRLDRTAQSGSLHNDDKGQSLIDRINNYQNIAFVINAQEVEGMEPLWGETYTLIPQLFVPRILWPQKPRAHQGQILLNLHYKRQASSEETENTYIAWGLLPEAVGNFGLWLGPIILGPLLGFLFGLLETWSRHKRLFSVEGMIALGLFMQILISFEMAASVFLTSTFQMVVAVGVGASILRILLGSGEQATARSR